MSMTKHEELIVIEAVRTGQIDRFETLVREYEGGIYRLCLRMLGNEQDALDAAQDTFFNAYRGLDGFRAESRFSTWLYRLASNVCLDMLRRRPAVPELSADEDKRVHSIADSAPSPQEALEAKELRELVDRAIAALPEEHRQVVILRDVNGLSYEEIASITGLEPGTVKSRIYRARKRLAAALMDDGNFLGLRPSKSTGARSGKGGADE